MSSEDFKIHVHTMLGERRIQVSQVPLPCGCIQFRNRLVTWGPDEHGVWSETVGEWQDGPRIGVYPCNGPKEIEA